MARIDVIASRFWAKVDRRGPDECWPWNGAIAASGYGAFNLGCAFRNKVVTAHRAAWMLTNGADELAPDIFICHRCDNQPCVNPAHLFPGTPLDNARDMQRKGRARSDHNAAKTCCPRGHPYTPENTYLHRFNGSTFRQCKTCNKTVYKPRRAAVEKAQRRARGLKDTKGRPLISHDRG